MTAAAYTSEAKLPIARFSPRNPAGWFVQGDGFTLQIAGAVDIPRAKRIAVVCAASLRASTPTPDPSPQGGGEQKHAEAAE